MRIVVALGGNALLRRGEVLAATTQTTHIREAARVLAAAIAAGHQLIITHGNGPQVGLLALQSAAGPVASRLPLDALDAASEGWIGSSIELELRNLLTADKEVVTLLTHVRVDPEDPGFRDPTKPIGPVQDEVTMRRMIEGHDWSIARDGTGWRRVVASPRPESILEITTIRRLADAGATVICAGGGGIPVIPMPGGSLQGVEAVLDKDATSGLLASLTNAALFVMLTDVDGVYLDYGKPTARAVVSGGPAALEAHRDAYQSGSMGPKVAAACDFVRATGRPAAIGALGDFANIIVGARGTTISLPEHELVLRSVAS